MDADGADDGVGGRDASMASPMMTGGSAHHGAGARSGRAEQGDDEAARKRKVEYYDDLFLDSDEEDDAAVAEAVANGMVIEDDGAPAAPMGSAAAAGAQRDRSAGRRLVKPSDDELLYDPELDDDNARWVEAHRRTYLPRAQRDELERRDRAQEERKRKEPTRRTTDGAKRAQSSGGGRDGGDAEQANVPVFVSDATLACPACLSTLCIDCQQHELYQHQFRAMFVMNCTVVTTEVLRVGAKPEEPAALGKSKRRQKKANKRGAPATSLPTDQGGESGASVSAAGAGVGAGEETEVYHPVRCEVCNTEVAVYDKDEVYHFHNVIASPTQDVAV